MTKQILILDVHCLSWNKMYAGVHWAVRKKQAEEFHTFVWAECKRQKIKKAAIPVKIVFEISYKNKRRHDPDNCNVKMFMDGLVMAKIIPDDNYKIVKEISIKIVEVGKKDEVKIIIFDN